MANLDPFTAQIVEYVRNMPDEALLELVRAHLTGSGPVQLPAAPVRARTSTSVAPSAPRRRVRKSKGKAKRSTPEQRQQLLDNVEKVVKKGRGMSASEVAKRVKVPQTRVASALRDLKKARRIYQGGERRFARYAGDAATAKKASEKARKTASGPIRKR